MSQRPLLLALALLASALAAAIALELDSAAPVADPTGIVPIRRAPLVRPRAATPAEAVDNTDEWVDTILTRPLFSRDRRPTPEASKGGGDVAISSMPRLTGVLVNGDDRRALFAAPEGGKPLVAKTGAVLGPYTIEAIEPGRVTVSGPQGTLELKPAYDAEMRKALLVELPQQQPQQQAGQVIQPGQPLQPGQPPQLLNLRPGSQFQRALSAIQNGRPQLQQVEVDR
jgi:hypothetical protein